MMAFLLFGLMLNQATPTPRQQLDALRAEYESARKAFSRAQAEIGDDKDRQKALAEKRAELMAFAGRLFALAEKWPDDPIVFDALATVVSGGFGLDDEVRALDELVHRHVRDSRLGAYCRRLKYLSRSPAGLKAELWLREIIAKSPDAAVRGQATFCLAEFLEDWAQFARYFRRNPDEAGQPLFRAMLGADCLLLLKSVDVSKTDDAAARLYTQVIDQYADVQDAAGKLGPQAKGRLFAIRNLALGRVAPEIVGEDLDGKPMRLSEFRGRVVMLSFWATWCGPCMGMVPRERELAARLANQPFTLVGVNGDEDRGRAKTATADEKMTWRSFWDGAPATGRIVNAWGIYSWPTVYILDTKGTIRFKNVDFPNKERFEDAVDNLLREATNK